MSCGSLLLYIVFFFPFRKRDDGLVALLLRQF